MMMMSLRARRCLNTSVVLIRRMLNHEGRAPARRTKNPKVTKGARGLRSTSFFFVVKSAPMQRTTLVFATLTLTVPALAQDPSAPIVWTAKDLAALETKIKGAVD